MTRFFSLGESRRKSRRLVPGGLPAGVNVEHLEPRRVLDGSYSMPAVDPMDAAITTEEELARSNVQVSGETIVAEVAGMSKASAYQTRCSDRTCVR